MTHPSGPRQNHTGVPERTRAKTGWSYSVVLVEIGVGVPTLLCVSYSIGTAKTSVTVITAVVPARANP